MKVLTQKYQDHVPCSFVYKLVCVDDKFTKPIVVFTCEKTPYEFVKAILKEYQYCKKVMKKHFNKKLIMSEGKEQFQQSNTCWICEKLIDDDVEKVRDHCHITGKFRGTSHWNFNINLQLTKNVSAIFHNLRCYDSHLIFYELRYFDQKIIVKPIMQFMNFSLEKLVKNLSDGDFK